MKLFFLVTVPLYLLDQVTKWSVLERIPHGEGIVVVPGFFNLVHTYNTGMAFGLLKNNNLFFVGLSFVALITLFVLAKRRMFQSGWNCAGALLLTAGVMGNLTDRLLHGHVIDFLEVYFGNYFWPAFNVADSCICVAVGLFLIGSFRDPEPQKREAVGQVA
jgi:signal peptidase II